MTSGCIRQVYFCFFLVLLRHESWLLSGRLGSIAPTCAAALIASASVMIRIEIRFCMWPVRFL